MSSSPSLIFLGRIQTIFDNIIENLTVKGQPLSLSDFHVSIFVKTFEESIDLRLKITI